MKKRIAISMGDPAGIGAEIVVKALNKSQIYEETLPIVVGDAVALQDALAQTGIALKINCIQNVDSALGEYGVIDCFDLGLLQHRSWEYGKLSALCGDAAFSYVTTAIHLAIDGKVDAVVTGPINKEALHLAGHMYSGHTEIFADFTHTDKYAMLLTAPGLRVIHVTTHVSMEEACRRIQKDRVLDVIKLAEYSARLLDVKSPTIGVAGLNPHSSENGLFGTQEHDSIMPAIQEARRLGISVDGPVPPDTVFVKALSGQYDVVVAMYHDQGHIPLKLCGFKLDPATGLFSQMSGVNITIGLPFIRTSVDHGTAFDRAGKNIANEESMVEAIVTAAVMSRNLNTVKTID